MKVKELIELLSQQDPEALVVISGYEDGLNDLDSVEQAHVQLNVNTTWNYGKYEFVASTNECATHAVYLA